MLHILLSDDVRRRLGERIIERMGSHPHRLLSPSDDPGLLALTDVAYLSRDVVGESSLTVSSPEMAAFHDILHQADRLKWLQIYSAGADRPLYTALRKRGVCITTAAGAASGVVAQTVLAGMLALNRRLPELWDAQRHRQWTLLSRVGWPVALEGQEAVVVGLGPIGREIARLLQMLGMRVHGVRRGDALAPECETTRSYARLDEILPRADWLILACPLSAQTHHLIDASRLTAMKHGATLVNVARGGVVDERAMVSALQTGQLGGAFLDVFETEPLPQDSPLWAMRQVMVSPHAASHSSATIARVEAMFLDHLSNWLAAQPLINALAPLQG